MGLDLISAIQNRRARKSNEKMNQATNEANILMNRETNAANQEINQANIDYSREAWRNEVAYNWEMWNAQNEYNSASAQRQRLEDAGLNPYMMMDGGSAGTASSSSAPSHNQPQQIPMQAGHVDPYYRPVSDTASMQNAFATLLDKSSDIALKREQQIGMGIDNQYREQLAKAEIAKLLADSHNTELRSIGQNIANTIAANTQDATIALANKQPGLLDAQIRKLDSDIAFNDANKELASMRAKLMPYDSWVKAMDVMSQVDLRDKQGRLVSAQEAESRARTALHKLEAEQRIRFTPDQLNMLSRYYMANAHNRYVEQYHTSKGLRLGTSAVEDVPEWLRKGGRAERWSELGGDFINTLGAGIIGFGAGRGVFKSLKKRPPVGFR